MMTRLLLALALALVVGLPISGSLYQAAASVTHQADRLATTSDVWTGQLPSADLQRTTVDGGSAPTERLVVRFKPQAVRTAQVDAHQQAGAVQADSVGLPNTVTVEVAAADLASALATYAARNDVEYVEPDYRVRMHETPNDTSFGTLWGMQKINAPTAWNVTHGSPNVKVAILDCGIFSSATGRKASDNQPGHKDLRGKVVLDRDFTGSSKGFDDYCDHGTHVAGTVSATTNNALGVAGVGYNVSLLNGKVLDDNGDGWTTDTAQGIIWATDNGAKVINMSFGRNGSCSFTETYAINYAWERGVVLVASAGNDNKNKSGAPASCANVISVAATDQDDDRAWFSNYGTNVDVAAPGVSILSTTRNGGYTSFNGTSMAAPHVAGLAALIWSAAPSPTAESVVNRISASAVQIGGTGTIWAWGRINAGAALSIYAGQPPAPTLSSLLPDLTPTMTPTQVPTQTSTPIVATATATELPATATPTQTPPPATATPTQTPSSNVPPAGSACGPARPPMQVVTTPLNPTALSVRIVAGKGLVQRIEIGEARNARINIGGQTVNRDTHVYTPAPATAESTFVVSQLVAGQPTMVQIVAIDECGPWPTFVGSGPSGFR